MRIPRSQKFATFLTMLSGLSVTIYNRKRHCYHFRRALLLFGIGLEAVDFAGRVSYN